MREEALNSQNPCVAWPVLHPHIIEFTLSPVKQVPGFRYSALCPCPLRGIPRHHVLNDRCQRQELERDRRANDK